MAPEPRLTVSVGGKIVGHVIKTRIAWHFRPGDDMPLPQPTTGRSTLKQLGEDLKSALGAKEIQFHEVPRPVKAAAKKRGRPRLRKLKLTEEEWRAVEREQSRLSPRPASLEGRDKGIGLGRPVSGGLPSLGKRR